MAATITVLLADVTSDQRIGYNKLVGDTSYPTGGYPISAASFGVGALTTVIATPFGTGTTCYVGYWDNTNNKLKFMKSQAGLLIEETATTNVSAFGFFLMGIGA